MTQTGHHSHARLTFYGLWVYLLRLLEGVGENHIAGKMF